MGDTPAGTRHQMAAAFATLIVAPARAAAERRKDRGRRRQNRGHAGVHTTPSVRRRRPSLPGPPLCSIDLHRCARPLDAAAPFGRGVANDSSGGTCQPSWAARQPENRSPRTAPTLPDTSTPTPWRPTTISGSPTAGSNRRQTAGACCVAPVTGSMIGHRNRPGNQVNRVHIKTETFSSAWGRYYPPPGCSGMKEETSRVRTITRRGMTRRRASRRWIGWRTPPGMNPPG